MLLRLLLSLVRSFENVEKTRSTYNKIKYVISIAVLRKGKQNVSEGLKTWKNLAQNFWST